MDFIFKCLNQPLSLGKTFEKKVVKYYFSHFDVFAGLLRETWFRLKFHSKNDRCYKMVLILCFVIFDQRDVTKC